MRNKITRRGFTILEMLVVVAVMAIIATLATGAAPKSLKVMRRRRIAATVSVLEAALNNYRAQENKWPFSISQMQHVSAKSPLYRASGEKNAVAFEELLNKDISLLGDTSGLLTRVKGRRMSVKEAQEKNLSPIAIGYPDPDNTDQFRFFTVEYNTITDSVKVKQ